MNIAVLISGGVDSSVALRLLKKQGHTLTAFYLKIWLEDELQFLGECPWEDDLAYVRAVCGEVGVPLEVIPFQKEYWERVVAYTIDEVKNGRTPNPDMLCNARIKFGAFYDVFGKQFDRVATGHYAQVEEKNGVTLLKTSPDVIKDQTYFLSQLSQTQVAHALFPIGGFAKERVRELAETFHLPNAHRKDSQGVCFLGKIPFDKFLEYHLGKRHGTLVEYETKTVLGKHDGFWYFTVGQRRGIRLAGGPWYVVAKNTETNEVFISHGDHHQLLARDMFRVSGVNWITGSAPKLANVCVKLRHGAKTYPCQITFLDNALLEVKLSAKDIGIAVGQFAVFYDGEYCLGGGTIEE
ncbi:MAG: tRNA 2-thiouridine(34) synthase MnmA [Minisyncoccota bacterium]